MPKSVERGRFVPEDENGALVLDGSVTEPELSDEEKAYLDFRNTLKAGEEMPTLRVSMIPKSSIGGNPMHAKLIYCFACTVDQYTYEELCEKIRDTYGGGLYRLMATKKGHRGTLFNQLLTIADPLPSKKNPTDPGPGNVSTLMETVAGLMTQQQERTEALFARLVPNATQVQAPDPFSMMAKVIEMLGTLGIGKAVASPQSDLLTELTKLAQLKGVLGGILGTGDNDGGGGGAAETNFYDLAGTTLKTIAPLLTTALASKGGFPALASPTPPPQPAPGAPANTAPAQPAAGAANVNLKRQVDILVLQAKNGATPEAVAEMVLDMTPEARYPELYDFINRPTVVNEMAAVNAEVSNHRPFFDQLRAAILRELGPEDAPAQSDPEPPATS